MYLILSIFFLYLSNTATYTHLYVYCCIVYVPYTQILYTIPCIDAGWRHSMLAFPLYFEQNLFNMIHCSVLNHMWLKMYLYRESVRSVINIYRVYSTFIFGIDKMVIESSSYFTLIKIYLNINMVFYRQLIHSLERMVRVQHNLSKQVLV